MSIIRTYYTAFCELEGGETATKHTRSSFLLRKSQTQKRLGSAFLMSAETGPPAERLQIDTAVWRHFPRVNTSSFLLTHSDAF